MMDQLMTAELLEKFRCYLIQEERSGSTINKYMHDVKCFQGFAAGKPVDKTMAVEYKAYLQEEYALTSANSMIAALNAFFRFAGWRECCIRQFKVQKKIYCAEATIITREEYERLVRTARSRGEQQLALIMQTMCGTGIRVSELQFITVEAVKKGEAVVECKGKSRLVFIVPELRKKLMKYIKEQNIQSGCIFTGRSGRPLHRCTVWKKMKRLCEAAGISAGKVFPHNLRHLFARVFYEMEKDIAKLADILGHTSINTTRIYMIETGLEHRRKMQRLQLII